MVEESKVAFVPHIMMSGAWLSRTDYALFLTDQRALLVVRRIVRLPVLWGFLAGGIGVGILLAIVLGLTSTSSILFSLFAGVALASLLGRVTMPRRDVDSNATLEDVANRRGTLAIPYAAMMAVSIKRRGRRVARLQISYSDPSGAATDVAARLLPDPEWFRSQKKKDWVRVDPYGEFLDSVRRALERALPREVLGSMGEEE